MSDAVTKDDALEVTLIGLRAMANGEVRLSYAVHKDDAWKTQHLLGKIGHPFDMLLFKRNYEATEDLAPVASADSNPMGALPEMLDSLNTPSGKTQARPITCAPAAGGDSSPSGTPSHIIQLGRLRTNYQYQNFMNETEGCARNAKVVKNWQLAKFNCEEHLTEIKRGSDEDSDAAAHLLKYKLWLNAPKYVGRDHPQHEGAA